jgi:hypothetical protein
MCITFADRRQSSPRSASTRRRVFRSSNRPSKTSRPASQRRAATARSRWRRVPSRRTTTPSWRRSWRSASARTSRSAETRTRARATRARLLRRRRLRRCLYANDYDGPLSKVDTGVWGLTAMGRACMQHIGHVQQFDAVLSTCRMRQTCQTCQPCLAAPRAMNRLRRTRRVANELVLSVCRVSCEELACS